MHITLFHVDSSNPPLGIFLLFFILVVYIVGNDTYLQPSFFEAAVELLTSRTWISLPLFPKFHFRLSVSHDTQAVVLFLSIWTKQISFRLTASIYFALFFFVIFPFYFFSLLIAYASGFNMYSIATLPWLSLYGLFKSGWTPTSLFTDLLVKTVSKTKFIFSINNYDIFIFNSIIYSFL